MTISPEIFRNLRILVVGDVMVDRYIIGDVSRISPEAPVPVLSVQGRKDVLGGAANVAANLTGLGCSVALWGVKGQDESAGVVEKLLGENGIENQLVETLDRPTTTKTRIVAGNQQIVRYDEENNSSIDSETERCLFSSFSGALSSARGVILSDYGKGVLKGSLCGALIQSALAEGIPVFVDPKGREWERYRGATCATPNESEFFAVSGESRKDRESFSRNARSVKEKFGFDNLLVTRGAKGMAFFPAAGDEYFLSATRVREVYDVSGAGDTVISVLAASVAAGLAWREAMFLANKAAGIVITRSGTSPISARDLFFAGEEDRKVCSLADAVLRVENWKKDGASVVFTNGCFDLLHPGHVRLLRQASGEGDRLVVGLNSDESVQRLKGASRPVLTQSDRAAILAAIDCVDLVVIFEEDTPRNLIRALLPSVLVKGGDYTPENVVGREIVEENGGKVVLVPLLEGKSTTSILRSLEKR